MDGKRRIELTDGSFWKVIPKDGGGYTTAKHEAPVKLSLSEKDLRGIAKWRYRFLDTDENADEKEE